MPIKALIVKSKPISLIFNKKKIWEIRGSSTKNLGRILLIESGAKEIKGECIITDCIKLDEKIFAENIDKHQSKRSYHELTYKNPYAWIIDKDSIIKYDNPIPYNHPNGAVIWVNINE